MLHGAGRDATELFHGVPAHGVVKNLIAQILSKSLVGEVISTQLDTS